MLNCKLRSLIQRDMTDQPLGSPTKEDLELSVRNLDIFLKDLVKWSIFAMHLRELGGNTEVEKLKQDTKAQM